MVMTGIQPLNSSCPAYDGRWREIAASALKLIIEMVDPSGSNSIKIDSGSNAIEMKCIGNFSIDATGKVTIKGTAGIEINTPAQLSAQGTGMAELKSTGILTIQGSLVKIN